MRDYQIITDSAADLSAELVEQLGVEVVPLRFEMDGVTYHNFPDNREMELHTFYEKQRAGTLATTAAANMADFMDAAEPFLKAGRDVLILAFSSGLSATYKAAELAAEDLSAQYPERHIAVVDTLSASLGQGLLVWHAARLKREGKSMEEVRDWVEENKLHLCHWFTVHDLMHLKRGGRVSGTTAILGSMLSIKPVLHVDNEGHLINVSKSRGRKASLMALVDRMAQSAIDPADQTIFICHGDCPEDAQLVADEVKKRFGVKEIYSNCIGPVIGAHSGAGVVAVFFLGKER